MRMDRAVRRWAVVLAVLVGATAPASAAVATPPTLPAGPRAAAEPVLATDEDEPPEPRSEAERAATLAEPAIVVIEVRWEGLVYDRLTGEVIDGEPVSASTRCTGAGVGQKGYLLTTRSCLDQATVAAEAFQQVVDRRVAAGAIPEPQAHDLLAELLLGATIGPGDEADPPERSIYVRRAVTDDEPMPASVVSTADPADGDVALIKIARSNQPVLPLADDADLAVGTELVTLECPAEPDDVTGVATPADPNADDEADEPAPVRPRFRTGRVLENTPEILVEPTSPTEPTDGAEALPAGIVLTHEAAIAGLVDASAPTGDRLVDLAAIRALLAEAEVDTELGQVDRDYRAGLDAYYEGRYGDAIARFDAVLAIIPAHLQAHHYREMAQNLRDAEGETEPPPTEEVVERVESWLGGRSWSLVGLVVLIAIVVFILHRRRPPAADPTGPDSSDADPATRNGAGADPAGPDGANPDRAKTFRRDAGAAGAQDPNGRTDLSNPAGEPTKRAGRPRR